MSLRSASSMRTVVRQSLVAATALLAACSGDMTSPVTRPSTQNDPPPTSTPGVAKFWENGSTVTWNRITRELVVKYATGAAPAVRIYTLVAVAQDRAVTALPPSTTGNGQLDDVAAIAGASATVLASLYPAEVTYLESKLTEQIQVMVPNRPSDVDAAVQFGRTIGTQVIEQAKTDGFNAPFTGTVPTCPGCWLPVPTPPALAALGSARTFLVASGAEFQPPPPPPFGSARFIVDLNEVRQIASTRTPVQDSIAKVWALQNGTVTTLGYWNQVGADLAAAFRFNERRAARTLAVMNMAGYDALVSSHKAKYTHWLIRPSQADPSISIAIGLPSFPSYPSNHATISAAAAAVLASAFPQERARLEADARMAGLSRIYGGIHYRFDMEAGLALGKAIGEYAASVRGPVNDPGNGAPTQASR